METIRPEVQPGFGFDAPKLDVDPPRDEPREEPRERDERELPPDARDLPRDGSTFNAAGYAAAAAAAEAKVRAALRKKAKGNADLSYSIMKAFHGATVRSRPLIISNAYTPAGAPKVGVVTTSAPEQYAPDGQALNAPAPRWQNGYNADIGGSFALAYTPVAGDVGKQLNVAITPSTAARPGIPHVTYPTARVIA